MLVKKSRARHLSSQTPLAKETKKTLWQAPFSTLKSWILGHFCLFLNVKKLCQNILFLTSFQAKKPFEDQVSKIIIGSAEALPILCVTYAR